MKVDLPMLGQGFTLTLLAAALSVSAAKAELPDWGRVMGKEPVFQRIASFPVFLNTGIDEETVAEIVDVTENGSTLVYTDGGTEKIGFIDISNPFSPTADGTVDVFGEPTSVAVLGNFALVAVNTSSSFTNPSGNLVVVNINTRAIAATLPLGGQPDAIAVSPDRRYAAIAIENERDEDITVGGVEGGLPQLPAGFLVIVDLVGVPTNWTLRKVDLDDPNNPGYEPTDPEPEYVDINNNNVAVVTLQENNTIALVDLPSGNVIDVFNAGSVNLSEIDTNENDLIELNSSLMDIAREPDGVTWISDSSFATADEGDLFGGSRGFTVYDISGNIIHTSGNSLEHLVVSLGHYPEGRSENKGNEPENVEVGHYGKDKFLFVGSERSSVVFVYKITGDGASPELVQTLPAGVGPEGLKAIPQRGLFVAASEEDSRDDKIRSVINIYQFGHRKPTYPMIVSSDRTDGTPIPWAALSGLAVDPNDFRNLYTIHDSFYDKSRIYKLDVFGKPAVITEEIVLNDAMSKLTMVDPDMVNGSDGTVNLDQEGIAVRADGGFWIASEGAGTVGSTDRPFETFNLLLKVTDTGIIEQVVKLPDSTNDRQVRFGYEGVASVGSGVDEDVFVAFQREWADDPDERVRIGRYDTASGDWTFYYYPLETPLSPNGGWVGLSELTYLGNDEFAVVERDNQAGPDAAIKRIYKFSIAGLTPLEDPAPGNTPTFPVVTKVLVNDLLDDLEATGGLVLEKIEGLTVLPFGTALAVNDNDGVDDSNGETQLLRFRVPITLNR